MNLFTTEAQRTQRNFLPQNYATEAHDRDGFRAPWRPLRALRVLCVEVFCFSPCPLCLCGEINVNSPKQRRDLQFSGQLIERGAQFPRDRDAVGPPLGDAAMAVFPRQADMVEARQQGRAVQLPDHLVDLALERDGLGKGLDVDDADRLAG